MHECDITHYVTLTHESSRCVTWVMAHYATPIRVSCHTTQSQLSRNTTHKAVEADMSHVTLMHESCRICMYLSVILINESWLMHESCHTIYHTKLWRQTWDAWVILWVRHSWTWRYECGMTHVMPRHACVWHDSCMCVTWLMHACDMTHECVWHDSCMRVTWLMHACDMTHACVWHDSCTRVI